VIGWLENPLVKWLLPVPMLLAVAPLAWLVFRSTWRRLEADALAWRRELDAAGRIDVRPLVTLTLGALILAMQEYYGQLSFFDQKLRPLLARLMHADTRPPAQAFLAYYQEEMGRVWWGLTRIGGYLVPYAVWRFAFPRDSLRDMGLRFAGLREHAWLYALFVVVMVPLLLIVARQPDFGSYYPICSTAGRSWVELAVWELVYISQFVTLEMFFRGWWLRGTRIFGTGAIFSMIVPYSMVHYGKPYLEACSALIAGVALGSLAARTRSIWAGVCVHVTVAILMDILSLDRKHQLPVALTPTSAVRIEFHYWQTIIWLVWAAALLVLAIKGIRFYRRRKTTA